MGKPTHPETVPDPDELSEDDLRIIGAQQYLNEVLAFYHEVKEQDQIDNERLRMIQKQLSEAGLLLQLAEVEQLRIKPIQEAIEEIERYCVKDRKDEVQSYIWRSLIKDRIFSAATTDPAREL